MQHALASLLEIENMKATGINNEKLNNWLARAVEIAASISGKIAASRKKDYTNPFRKMIYDSETEMNNVLGKFDRNNFVLQQQKEFIEFKHRVETIKSQLFKIKPTLVNK